jgi:purine-binding chemotaxis protein CheW
MQAGPDIITFTAGGVVYGVDVGQVREILDMQPLAPVPNAPRHLLGSLDIRGESLIVVDLRTMLGLPVHPDTPQTRIIVVWVTRNGRSSVVGLRTDQVIEVLRLEGPVGPLQGMDLLDWPGGGVCGVGRHDGKAIGILDLARLLSAFSANNAASAAA